MRYSVIRKYDASNWEGINTTIFFTGCHFYCKGCFNKDIQSFTSGDLLTKEIIDKFIEYAKDEHVKGICILGGEPFHQNLNELYKFIFRLRTEVKKPIHIWTGYLFEDLFENNKSRVILQMIDTLVDGKFVISKKDLTLKYRGSSNQRVIDVQQSLYYNKIKEVEGV